MGGGYYQASDWAKLKNSRNLSSANSANQTFARRMISEELNSKFIGIRESFDSETSPNSTPVIIGFDVTGSMGFLANEIATKSLNKTITEILSRQTVVNPHFMCAAFTSPDSPIQATQFEADIRVVKQLLDFRLGGANRFSFDNLLWYFAAKHTEIHSMTKRGKKGILISIGDEVLGGDKNILTPHDISNVFDDKCNTDYDLRTLYDMASEKYEIVHIVIGGNDRLVNNNPRNSYIDWREVFPDRVARIHSSNVKYLADVIIAVIRLINGETKEEILKSISDTNVSDVVSYAINDMNIVCPLGSASALPKEEPTSKQSIIGKLYDLFGDRK